MPTSVVWFRRDLRVHDHPGLRLAVDAGDAVAPLFVVDEHLLQGRWPSPNRMWFMAGSVGALAQALAERGAPLTIIRGHPVELVARFAAAVGAQRVIVSRDYTPYGRKRDDAVRAALSIAGVMLEEAPGLLVHELEAVRRADGGGFSVFGPFHRAWAALERRGVGGAPGRIRPADPNQRARAALGPLHHAVAFGDPAPTADTGVLPSPGEPAARRRLAAWAGSDGLSAYDRARDRLDLDGTSRLSQDLRWGLLSPVEVLDRCALDGSGPIRFATEVAWRDFYAHLLFQEPGAARSSFRPEFNRVGWRRDADAVDAWQAGRTGYPIVDAGMRQLLATGWMHNRARMVVASFLTKDLLIDWRVGEAHFMRHLVDGDPASNNGGWQWAASTGTDPQPWFRIFNPTLQGRRHDPTGAYVRRWVPELSALPDQVIHEPDTAARKAAGYPEPIVDHGSARERAIAAYSEASARGHDPNRLPQRGHRRGDVVREA